MSGLPPDLPDSPDPRVPDASWRVVRTADGSATLEHAAFGETYHSLHGAVAEARHVFLGLSGIGERLAASVPSEVVEIGFGTGLNFLVTADAALEAAERSDVSRDLPPGTPRLVYRAVERALPPADVLERLDYAGHLRHPRLATGLVAAVAALEPTAGHLRIDLGGVRLEVELGDAASYEPPPERAHAVYLDAFSAETQPELWTAEALARYATMLAPGGRLCTYSVKGVVRRRLAALGLDVAKRPGPVGGKREALVATRSATPGGGPDPLSPRG